jgi:hypothetical protein
MPGRHRGQPIRLIRRAIPAPDDMHVRSEQQNVAAIEVAGRHPGGVNNVERRSVSRKGALEPAGVRPRAAQPQQRVAMAEMVLQRRAVVEPDMRQPGLPATWSARRS